MRQMPLIRTISLVTLTIAFGLVATGRAGANDQSSQVIQVAASDAGSRFVPLGIGKSVVIDLPRDVKDVLVADPKIANAVIRTARRAYIIGSTVGQTNVYFFDQNGQQIIGLDIAVTRDLNGLRAAIRQALPNADVRVEGIGDGVVLSGNVQSPVDAQTAFDIATRLVDDGRKVVNGITIHGRDQVMLKVTVAEVQREVMKQLGVNLSGEVGSGSSVFRFLNNTPFPVTGQPIIAGNAISAQLNGITATLRAMERAGVIRTLAEPTLTAISGESANFLAGGEFPVQGGVTCNGSGITQSCTQQILWKKFGVSLGFTPVVLSEGRISLKIMTEVSELSTEAALETAGQATVPSIRTRRADTTLEIPSGGSLAMAGMIQEQTKQQINGLPGLMQVPVLGQLFRSRDFVNRQTELVVIVTPYVVRAVAQKNLSRPDDGFADASDPATVLLGRLNRIYGVTKPKDPNVQQSNYRGNYGFILD